MPAGIAAGLLCPILKLLANLAAHFYNPRMSAVEWHFLDARRLPWPVPWQVLFQRPAPLMVEIGFGNGQFLLDLAARRPDANVIGLEISQPSLRKTQRKLHARQQGNVLIVHADAVQALWTLFAPRAISAVAVNFPDPWPKAAHEQRRLLSAHFLSLMASRMHVKAELDIATDDVSYAGQIGRLLSSCSHFSSRLETPFVHEDPERLRTKYESRALEEGRSCFYFKWRRSEDPSHGETYPIPRELPMPHVILRPRSGDTLSLAELAQSLEPVTHTEEWGVIRFISFFVAHDEPQLLIDTYVDEPVMAQRLALLLRARADGSLVLSIHELGFPRATPGVHRAIRRLAMEITGRCPQLTIASSNLAH